METLSIGGVELYPTPRDVVVRCRSAQDRANVPVRCPIRLPRPSTNLGYTALAPSPFSVRPLSVLPSIEELRRLPREERRQAREGEVNGIDISYSAEAGRPRRDQPERFLHFDLQTREHRDELPPGVGSATLGDRRGLLAAASGRGYAGEPYFANHVRFFWKEDGSGYAATLHNFGPATRAVLDALLGTLQPAGQLEAEEPPLASGVERVPVPVAGPVSVATDASGVWAAGGRALVGLDSESLEPLSDPVGVRGFPPSLAANDALWIAHPASYAHDAKGFPRRGGDALQRLDPTGSRFAKSIRAGPDPTGVAVGHGSVWLTDLGGSPGGPSYRGGAVQRIDPESGEIVARIPVGRAPAAIAVGEGSVWATNNLDGTVTEIDPRTNRSIGDVSVEDSPTGIATGFGATWVANTEDSTVSRIEPDIGDTAKATIAVGRGPRGVAVGEGSVWVSNYLDDTVSRIDPATNEVIETVRVGSGPVGIAVGHSAVWVATAHDRALFRIDPQP